MISRLNALSHLSPDEIVAKLKNRGWRKPSELGQEYFEEHKNSRFVYCQIHNDGSMGANSMTQRTPWRMSHCSRNYGYFVSMLETADDIYWLIPHADFTGEPPHGRPS